METTLISDLYETPRVHQESIRLGSPQTSRESAFLSSPGQTPTPITPGPTPYPGQTPIPRTPGQTPTPSYQTLQPTLDYREVPGIRLAIQ